MAQTCTNFGEYPTGTPSDWTLTKIAGASTMHATVEANASALSGQWVKLTVTGGFWAGGLFTWNDIAVDDAGEILALIRLESDTVDGDQRHGVAARASLSGSTSSAIITQSDFFNDLVQLRYINSGSNTAMSTTVAKTLNGATDYWIRYNFNGRNYRLKVWEFGTTEPSAWDKDYTATSEGETTSAGRVGLHINRLEPSGFDNDRLYLHFFGYSDDPSTSVAGPTGAFHDATTTVEGLSSINWTHAQAALTNGLAVLRVVNVSGGQVDLFPEYDGTPMTYADITNGGVTGRVPNGGVGIWYLVLGASPGSTTASMDIQGVGGDNAAVKAAVSTYNGCDQSDPVVAVAGTPGFVSGPNDTPDTDDLGVVLNMDGQGYLVVDVYYGDTDRVNEQCSKIVRADDSDFSTAAGYAFGDRTSDGPAGYMYYLTDGLPVSMAIGAVSFRKALPTFTPTFDLGSEHLLKIAATFNLPSEHLREIIEEIRNRKRLWIEVGQDTRTLKIEV